VEQFCWRIEHALIREGGFALIQGDPGTGKSAVLRLLDERLAKLPEVSVGAISHPSSNLADFYREMGDLFAVELRPHNRWGGFKALRERWLAHLEATLLRPVLLIDEAQEMHPAVLNELRLLTSMHFDSRTLLSVILAGDARLAAKLRREELLPLGSRIRSRLTMEYASREELLACLQHLQRSAGNASLMTAELMNTLAEHALGNYRVLTTMAAELLTTAAQQERSQLDEQLYLEVFGVTAQPARKRA
jgi:type II secretory pathway predicted ATPase ExeA